MNFWKLQSCDNLITHVTDIKLIDTSEIQKYFEKFTDICLCWATGGSYQFLRSNKASYLKCSQEMCVMLTKNEDLTVTTLESDFKMLVITMKLYTMVGEMTVPLEVDNYSQNISKETQLQFRLLADFVTSGETNELVINSWCSLLLAKIRADFENEYKKILLSQNAVAFLGNTVVTQEKPFEINFTDVMLKVDTQQDEKLQTILYKSKSNFVERPTQNIFSSRYVLNGEKKPYYSFKAKKDTYYKIWFFHEDADNVSNVSPFGSNVKLCFSVKANECCKFMIAISNCVDYTMVGSDVIIDRCNQWIDCEVTLFEGEKVSTTNSYIHFVIDYINAKFRSKLTTTDIATMVHLHPSYLSRVFKEQTGCTISRFINARRITEAKQLLHETDWTVEAIALHVGFYDTHHFQKCFRANVGCSPSEYRKGVLCMSGGDKL